ncbi:MAG TPA: hypothetical protein EYQ18_01845 [Candidatus Handelsmanbacteria bacterium]|nr:hypothetical protein [Candidatus Handelsmanbacteria bacterium]
MKDDKGGDVRRDGQLLAALAGWSPLRGPNPQAVVLEQLAEQSVAVSLPNGNEQSEYFGVGIGGILYLAAGLASFAGQGENRRGVYWQRARELVLYSLDRSDKSGYIGQTQRGITTTDGARCLGDWAQILSVCIHLLRQRADREVHIAAARAVAAMLNYHYQPDLGLMVELTSREFFLYDDERASYVHGRGALAALGGLMAEAERGKEEKLITLVGRYLRQHLEVAWDPVDGGLRDEYVDGTWAAGKSAEVQGEALVALAVLVSCRGGDWEMEWFGRVYEYWLKCERLESPLGLCQTVDCVVWLAGLLERDGRSVDWLTGVSEGT